MQEICCEFALDGHIPQTQHHLQNLFSIALARKLDVVFVCVGTSKIVGDCFGPTLGDKLILESLPVWVYGTTKSNVCATNLQATLKVINLVHPHSIVVVLDAMATPNATNLGNVILSNPYVGVNKQVFVDADLFLYATTTYLGHGTLHAKLEIINKLALIVKNTIAQAFNSSFHNLELEFLKNNLN